MSHAIIGKSENTRITDIPALRAAVQAMKLGWRECTPRKGHYRTWKDAHGKWAGDWPLPDGVSAEEMGDNADFVISVPGNTSTYEVGIVWNEQDKCWYPAHDFYNSGYGLENHIGKTEVHDQKMVKGYTRLMSYYRAALQVRKARAAGKQVEFAETEGKIRLRIQ